MIGNYCWDIGGKHEILWPVEEISWFFTQNPGSNDGFARKF